MCSFLIIQIDEWFAGIILTSLLGLIAWIFVRSTQSQDELSKSVTSLRITLEGIRSIMDSFVDEREQSRTRCTEKHTGVDEQLKRHEETIKKHSEKITIIETTLQIESK